MSWTWPGPTLGSSSPPLSHAEELRGEYSVLGLSTGDHVMALYRSWLTERGVLSSRDLENCEDGERVRIAGLVAVHQAPPTAKGHHFLTLEDEAGLLDIIVRLDIYARHRRVLRQASLLLVEGTVQGIPMTLSRPGHHLVKK